MITCAAERFAGAGGDHAATIRRQDETYTLIAHNLAGTKGVAQLVGKEDLLNGREQWVPGARVCRSGRVDRPLAQGRTACKPDETLVRAI